VWGPLAHEHEVSGVVGIQVIDPDGREPERGLRPRRRPPGERALELDEHDLLSIENAQNLGSRKGTEMPNVFTDTRVLRAVAGLCFSLALAGCPAEESVDVEGCEHLKRGPAVAIASGGAIRDDHQRYDLSLDPSANPSGMATFASSREDDYYIFLNKDIRLAVRQNDTIVGEEFLLESPECTEIAVREKFHLHIGTYAIVFGSTSETTVSIVIEGENAPE
jgi:hypothetical protein